MCTNVQECIQTTAHFSYTVWQNVCDGTQYIVQNGFWDYVALFLLSGIGVAILLVILIGGIMAIFN